MVTVCMLACVILGVAVGSFIGFDMAYKRMIRLQLPMVLHLDNFFQLMRGDDDVDDDEQDDSERA